MPDQTVHPEPLGAAGHLDAAVEQIDFAQADGRLTEADRSIIQGAGADLREVAARLGAAA